MRRLGQNSPETIESRLGSLPVPLSERTWNPWLAAAVCATAAIATWSFVMGGFTASFVNARAGTATMLGGALIAQFLITLAQVPPATKYGLETVVTTKPQLGVRGSHIALFIQYAVLIGWNLVLTIFLGRAVSSVLVSLDLIKLDQESAASVTASIVGTVLVWLLLARASKALAYVGPAVAITVVGIGAWMLIVLFRTYSLGDIASAAPVDPIAGGKLTNYMVALEAMIVATLGWWAYMGGMLRTVNSPGKAVLPSMASLGLGWAAIGLISVYSALVTGEWDPTIWMVDLGGPVSGLIVLVFIIFANVGSTLVGTHAAVLGVGQVPAVAQRVKSWNLKSAMVLSPMIVILLFFADEFYDNIGIFLGFVGVMVAPIIGIQIVDWYVLGRIRALHLPSLYRHDSRSQYWYVGGFNVAGLIALIAGSGTYLALLNPITYMPRSVIFEYTTASLPAVLAGAFVYWIMSVLIEVRSRKVGTKP